MRGKRHTGERGQAFEAYRVLIAAVIAIAVLVIIVSTISYFDRLKEEVSTDTLNASWKSAVDAPNGKVIRAQDLSFNQGTTFSRRAFAKQVNLVDTCLVFDAEKAAGYTLHDEDPANPYVEVTGNVIGSVYIQCHADPSQLAVPILSTSPECYAYCLLSFGKLIRADS